MIKIKLLEKFQKKNEKHFSFDVSYLRSLGQFSQLIFPFHENDWEKYVHVFHCAFGSLIEFLRRNKINFSFAFWLHLWDEKQYADPANLISLSLALCCLQLFYETRFEEKRILRKIASRKSEMIQNSTQMRFFLSSFSPRSSKCFLN